MPRKAKTEGMPPPGANVDKLVNVRCPECWSDDSKITKVANAPARRKLRLRRCNDCQFVFVTVEQFAAKYTEADFGRIARAEDAKQRAKAK